MRKWLPLAMLCAAQFIMVLDSSVMNVSITQIAADLGTTITGVQLAITAYTLVMAAFMLVGAKLGDIMGLHRAFPIGLLIYGTGSFLTALSQNLGMLLFGWSLIEGLGAVLVIPAIAALTAANYEGKMRALAYGLIGATSAVAVAAGPLIGGWVTTNVGWQWVFAGETVVVLAILPFRGILKAGPRVSRVPKLDYVGAALSAAGLALIVFGILKSSEWGLVRPRGAPTINGHEITPFGFSVVPFLILAGLGALWAFSEWEARRERRGLDALLDLKLFRIVQLRSGLMMLTAQQVLLMGTFFIIPVYLQTVLGLDAFETGKRMFPLSIAMLLAALAGPKMAGRRSPKRVVQIGLAGIALGALAMMQTIDLELNETGFKFALILFGAGAGLLASQLGNVIMSSVDSTRTSEAGGLQGTAQNLGSSIGTALIGAVLLIGLSNGFADAVMNDPSLPQDVRTAISAQATQGVPIVSVSQAETAAVDAGLSTTDAATVAHHYGDAEVKGLKEAVFAVAILALLSFFLTKNLPDQPTEQREAEPIEAPAAAPA